MDHEEGQPEHIRRDLLRLRGRQALLDLLVRIERERQGELQGLLEHRAVSDFAHRNRIQSLLRGRFLRNERPSEEERPPSGAASELNQLRQRHTVSGLREGFRSRLENIVRGQVSSHPETSSNNDNNDSRYDQSAATASQEIQLENQVLSVHQLSDHMWNLDSSAAAQTTNQHVDPEQGSDWLGEITEDERASGQQSAHNGSNEWMHNTTEETDRNQQENPVFNWPLETVVTEDAEQHHLQVVHDVWRDNSSLEAVENWSEVPSDPPRMRRSVPYRRVSRFLPPEDDNVYSMELRELLSRRSVSNPLRSGFRESFDQLLQSYVEKQGRIPIDWDLHGNLTIPSSSEKDQDQLNDKQNEDQHQ